MNEKYGKGALYDCLSRGESPFASHLLYTQVLNDFNPTERKIGINAGLAFYKIADICAVYEDLGLSSGMLLGIDRARILNVPIEYRSLSGWS